MLVSSHLMSEMQQTADRLVVIGRGRLIADTTTADLLRGVCSGHVRVRSSQSELLLAELRRCGFTAARVGADELHIADSTGQEVGAVAHAADIPLHHIAELEQSLEEAYLALTGDSVEYAGRQMSTPPETP